MKKKLRRLVVDGAPYLWSVGHLHFPRNEPPGHRCAERLTVYREGFRKAPAKLTFVATDGVLVGYPSSGVVVLERNETFNLHTPSLVARLIRGLEGWEPEHRSSPWMADDGIQRLRALVACEGASKTDLASDEDAPTDGSAPLRHTRRW
ncbi:MAG: hypothetical protein H6720_21825 [Sandaracinus sp.]|nr:hypothetical protein [Sandaracinus sp.]